MRQSHAPANRRAARSTSQLPGPGAGPGTEARGGIPPDLAVAPPTPRQATLATSIFRMSSIP